MKTLFLVATFLALASAPAFAECQPADAPITGRLALLETRHPAGHEIRSWVLLTSEICVTMEMVDGKIADVTPGVVQLVFAEGKEPEDLMALAAEEVTARGEPMEPHTAWHVGDVVLMNATIE